MHEKFLIRAGISFLARHPTSVCMHVGSSFVKPFSGRASRSRVASASKVAHALPTPRLVRWTRGFTGILHEGVPTSIHVLGCFCVRMRQNAPKQQARGEPKRSLSDLPSLERCPRVSAIRGAQTGDRGMPRVHHPLFSCRPFCPCSSRRGVVAAHLPSNPRAPSRPPSQVRGAQRAKAQLCSTPLRELLFRHILNPRGASPHYVCKPYCPCSLPSERSICAMRVVHHARLDPHWYLRSDGSLVVQPRVH